MPRGVRRRLSAPDVRPTARGWQTLAVAALSLGAAVSLGTTQLYQLGYALLGLVAAAFVLGLLGARALGVERRMTHCEGIYAGEPVEIWLRLTNGSRVASTGVAVEDRTPEPRVCEHPSVPAGGERLVHTAVSFPRRGLYELGPVDLVSTDPFGLLSFRRDAGQRAEALVYPALHPLAGLPVRGAEEAGGRSLLASRGEEPAGLRGYRRGDDPRMIHWKSVARTGDLVVKEFAPDAPRRYTVMLDLFAEDWEPGDRELEDAVSAAASAFAHLEGSGLSPRLRLTDREASSTRFSEGGVYRQAMRLLATARTGGGEPTDEALLTELSSSGLGEGIVLVQRDATRSRALPQALRELSAGGVCALVILTASHTYRPCGPDLRRQREAGLASGARLLEDAGAAVLVVRAGTGVAGLAPAGESPWAGGAG